MKFMQALQDLLNRGEIIKFEGREAVKMDKWRDECVAQGLLDETKKDSKRSMLSQYRRELIGCNLVACRDDTVWIVHAPDWLQKAPVPFDILDRLPRSRGFLPVGQRFPPSGYGWVPKVFGGPSGGPRTHFRACF